MQCIIIEFVSHRWTDYLAKLQSVGDVNSWERMHWCPSATNTNLLSYFSIQLHWCIIVAFKSMNLVGLFRSLNYSFYTRRLNHFLKLVSDKWTALMKENGVRMRVWRENGVLKPWNLIHRFYREKEVIFSPQKLVSFFSFNVFRFLARSLRIIRVNKFCIRNNILAEIKMCC